MLACSKLERRMKLRLLLTMRGRICQLQPAVSPPYEPQSKMLRTCKAPEIRRSNAFCEIKSQDVGYHSQVTKDYIFFNGKVK